MKNSIVLLLLIVPLNIFCQLSWPIFPIDTQHTVTGKVGEYRDTDRFHKGVDIIGTSQDVYAIEDGVVDAITNIGTSIEQIRVGNLWYVHVVSDVVIGDVVLAGVTKLGTMYSINNFPTHVHLEDVTRNLLYENISPYIDTVRPTIEATSFRRNGHNRYSATDPYTETISIGVDDFVIVFGKIDLVVNANDRAGIYTCAPSSLSYQILKEDGVTSFEDEVVTYQFGGTELSNTRASTCFGFGTAQNNFNYILTSHPSEGEGDRYFNTILRQNVVEDWSSSQALDARLNEEANYADNLYQIKYIISDVDEHNNPNFSDEESVRFLIDNFRPYIKSVKIYRDNSNGPLLSHYEWVWTDDHLELEKYIPGIIDNNDILYIKVEASEPMRQVYLKIPSVSFYEVNNTPIEGSHGYEFEFIVNHSFVDGMHPIEIEGDDYANNGVQSDPSVISIRQNNDTWLPPPVEGIDQYHSFWVGPNLPPNAMFSPTIDRIYIGEEIQFMDESTNDPDSWYWDFGDGRSGSTEQNPSYVYSNPGTYQVTLTVNNEVGQDTKTGTITVDDPCALTCNFNASPRCFVVGNSTNFFDNSYSNDGSVVSWQWRFYGAEQTTSTIQNPSGIRYPDAGSFDVELTVTDSEGNSDVKYMENYISTYDPDIQLSVDCSGPIISHPGFPMWFPVTVTNGSSPYQYQFTIDGSTQTITTMDSFHSFYCMVSNPGVYPYTVNVIDGNGLEGFDEDEVRVGTSCSHTPAFIWEYVGGEPGLEKEIILTDISSGGMMPYSQWYWNWGGDPGLVEANGSGFTYEVINNPWLAGDINGNPQARLKFTDFGTYPVSLTVYDAEGCPATVTQYLSIEPNPSCITLYHDGYDAAIIGSDKFAKDGHLWFLSNGIWEPDANPDGSCEDDPLHPGTWGPRYTDVSNIRWWILNSSYNKYDEATDNELGAWYVHNNDWFIEDHSLPEGKHTVLVELWNRMHEGCYNPEDVEPENRGLICWYDAAWENFIVVDCEKTVDITTTIPVGEYENQYAGYFNISPGATVIIAEGVSVNYEACEQIDLLPGLDIEKGSDFTALVDPIDVINKAGESMAATTVSTSNIENKTGPDFYIYPNPNNGKCYISFNEAYIDKKIQIMIFDHQGKLVYEQNQNRHDELVLELGHLINGLYFINVNGRSRKMVIIK